MHSAHTAQSQVSIRCAEEGIRMNTYVVAGIRPIIQHRGNLFVSRGAAMGQPTAIRLAFELIHRQGEVQLKIAARDRRYRQIQSLQVLNGIRSAVHRKVRGRDAHGCARDDI
jgi:hypothetical protein